MKTPKWLDFCLEVGREKDKGNGEDGFCHSIQSDGAMVGVFDGCGGLGAKHYDSLEGKSGAYIAARVTAAGASDWFEHSFSAQDPCKSMLEENIIGSLDHFYRLGGSGSEGGIKGSMSADFPTTAAMAVCCPNAGGILARCYWAGDSRVFILDSSGLVQLTKDDVAGDDLRSSMYCEGILTNVICHSRPWELHEESILLGKPAIIIAATDGCFGYTRTPMDFEYLLLDTLQNAKSPLAWETLLDNRLSDIAQDDYSIQALTIGYGSFTNLKQSLSLREHSIRDEYIIPMDNMSVAEREELWIKYSYSYLWSEKKKQVKRTDGYKPYIS